MAWRRWEEGERTETRHTAPTQKERERQVGSGGGVRGWCGVPQGGLDWMWDE